MSAGLDPRCQAARVWISASVDVEASEAERHALRLHLADCQACRSWAALAESVSLQVRTSAPLEPGRPFAFPEPEPVPVLEERRARRRLLPGGRARLAAYATPLMAAAAIGGVLLTGSLQRAPTPPQSDTPRNPVITVAAVDSRGFVAGGADPRTPDGIDVKPSDTRLLQSIPEPIPHNLALPDDTNP